MKKVIIGFVGFIIIFVAMILTWHFTSFDLKPIEDSDLIIEIPSISKEENAYYDLKSIGENMWYSSDDDFIKGLNAYTDPSATEKEVINTFLNENSEVSKLLKSANIKKFYVRSLFENFEKINLYDVSVLEIPDSFLITRYVILKSYSDLLNNKPDDALAEVITMLELIKKMESAPDNIVGRVTHLSDKKRLLDAIITIIETNKLTHSQLVQLKQNLENLRTSEALFADTLKCEYLLTKQTIDYIDNHKDDKYLLGFSRPGWIKVLIYHNFYFQPNRTTQLVADHYRKMIAKQDIKEDLSGVAVNKISWETLTTRNALGNYVYMMWVPSLGPDIEKLVDKESELFNLLDSKIVVTNTPTRISKPKVAR